MKRFSNAILDFAIACREAQGPGTLSFLWSADTHFQRTDNHVWGADPELIEEVCDIANLTDTDFVTVAGDLVNGYYDLTHQKRDLFELCRLMRQRCKAPLMLTMGNHDDNAWYSSGEASRKDYGGTEHVLCKERWYSIALGSSIDDFVYDEANPWGGWYYKDFKRSKIRVIVLTTTDLPYIENPDKSLRYYGQWTYGFRQQQLEWLADKGLRFDEEGWAVITITHVSYAALALAIPGEKLPYNSEIVCGLLDCFKRRTRGRFEGANPDFPARISCDFGNNPSNEFIASFNGHIHSDLQSEENGILSLSTEDLVGHKAFDIVTIDRGGRQIICKKYNDGPRPERDRLIRY
ncbi:MAG: metallophosphoesterase [Abditibacteriota bacterium]|nr:metallophosphoesterase [Abditibacteriota bacterium]